MWKAPIGTGRARVSGNRTARAVKSLKCTAAVVRVDAIALVAELTQGGVLRF